MVNNSFLGNIDAYPYDAQNGYSVSNEGSNDKSSVTYQHPSYRYNKLDWLKCRDVVYGQKYVKARGVAYLPKLKKQRGSDYNTYIQRADFFEASGRAVFGLVGLLFSKDPVITPDKSSSDTKDEALYQYLKRSAIDYEKLLFFAKKIATEVLTVGRVGILVDTQDNIDDDVNQPYMTYYLTESITNWRYSIIQGKKVLTMVVLHELVDNGSNFGHNPTHRYRVLTLTNDRNVIGEYGESTDSGYVYTQQVYTQVLADDNTDKNTSPVFSSTAPIVPTKNGIPFDTIPFFIISKEVGEVTVSSPPLIGLFDTNLSHYRTSATLENALFFLGAPTPILTGFSFPEGSDEIRLGNNNAIVTDKPDARGAYLEFKGDGLNTLTKAMEDKENKMLVLGARLLESPSNVANVGQSDKSFRLGESSVLGNISDSISAGMSAAMSFVAYWGGYKDSYDVNDTEVGLSISKEFDITDIDTGFFNSMLSAWNQKAVSGKTFFDFCRRYNIVPSDRSYEEEQDMITKDMEDVDGYPIDNPLATSMPFNGGLFPSNKIQESREQFTTGLAERVEDGKKANSQV